MKRVLITLLLSLTIFASLPIGVSFAELPEFPESEDVYIVEGTCKSTIVNQNADKEIALGDLSDLMVSKVALDTLQGKLSSSVEITADDLKILSADETGIFNVGQALTYQDLLNILLLTSNDNAAKLIGINIGRKLSGTDEIDDTEALNIFIEKLNNTCTDLKLANTKFSDVTGENNTTNLTDLATMTQAVLGDKTVQNIINSDNYEVKLKQNSTANEEKKDSETKETEKKEDKVIPIENKNTYILTVANSNQLVTSEEETTDSSTKETEKNEEVVDGSISDEEVTETEDKALEDSDVKTQAVSLKLDRVEPISTSSEATTSITTGYFSGQDSENATGVFFTAIQDAQIAGVLTNNNVSSIANQISQTVNELKNNYEFVDLSDSELITTKYKIANPHFSSSKNITLTGIDTLRAFLPIDDTESKTKIVWDENYVVPTGETYELKQSIEPLTQIATLEITNGDQSFSIPLYNADRLTLKNWVDTFLKVSIITVVVIVILLIVWRLIYVHNRRKVLRRQKLRRIKRRRQLQARQVAMRRTRNQGGIN